jgi:hypothetical protein
MTMPQTNLSLVHGGSRLEFTCKETAALIRQALKAAFPGVKFSVTTAYGSMTSSTNVRWTDGPTEPEVSRVTVRFTSQSFDGSTDSTNYHDQIVNGQRVSYSGWVHTRRELSADLLELALRKFQLMRAEYGLPAANVYINTDSRMYPHVDGADINAEAGISPIGYRFMFRYVSDAVQSIASTMRPNGCRVTLKGQ